MGFEDIIEKEIDTINEIEQRDQSEQNQNTETSNENDALPLFNGDAWDSYRVGYVLKGGCVGNTLQDHCDRESFQGTIASEYARECIEMSPGFDGKSPAYSAHACHQNRNLMRDILARRQQETVDRSNTNNIDGNTDAIMHLRIGDVTETICDATCVLHKLYLDTDEISVDYFHRNEHGNAVVFDLKDKTGLWRKTAYLNSLKFYESTIPQLRQKGIKRITIIAGSQYHWFPFKISTYFVKTIKELYELNGFEVSLKVGAQLTPDNALLFGSQHKTFIRAAGGYSEMLEFAIKSLNPGNTLILSNPEKFNKFEVYKGDTRI